MASTNEFPVERDALIGQQDFPCGTGADHVIVRDDVTAVIEDDSPNQDLHRSGVCAV
jgi:hypothetical protein